MVQVLQVQVQVAAPSREVATEWRPPGQLVGPQRVRDQAPGFVEVAGLGGEDGIAVGLVRVVLPQGGSSCVRYST
jgi:hypothetical protein